MKTKLLAFFAALALVSGLHTVRAAEVSVSVFYESLDPLGEWVDTADYGYVWHPGDVDENWRPYTVGNWAYTDAGWTWVSEEPFGWATYHYGRWIEIDRLGWSWVPDTEWGPAWVSWRRSDRHVGWAPLPPEARFEARIGIHDWSDAYYDIGPASYSFVQVRDFGAPRLRTVIVQPRENITIITETRNITNITYVNNVVVNQGPQYDVIVRESAQPIRRLRLERRTDLDYRSGGERNRFNAEISGDTLRVAAPRIQASRDVAPRRVAQKLDRVSVDRGWKQVGDAQTTERVRAKIASEAKVPADLPPISRSQAGRRGTDAQRQATSPEAVARPGASPTAEAPAPADAPMRDRKSGSQVPATAGAVEEKKATGRPSAATSAERPAATPSRQRPVAETEKPARSTTRPTAEDGQKPATAVQPPSEIARPDSAARGKKNRPESRRPGEVPATSEPRPETERPRRSISPEADKPARQPERGPSDRPAREQPSADRPPAAVPERPERPLNVQPPERKAAPPVPEDRRPQRQVPPSREDRGPDRSRPQAAERSPESRPPAPESRRTEAPEKSGDKPEKQEDKKKDKKGN